MTHRRTLILCFVAIGLFFVAMAGWWWYAQFQPLPFKLVLQGSSSSSDDHGVTGGNLVVIAPAPGVFFGTVRKPGSQEQFTYLILFRYGRASSNGSNQGIEFSASSDGTKMGTINAIKLLDDKRIEAAYHVELNETSTSITSESLTIGGKRVDMKFGQVFLIDLTAESPTYQQKKVELPSIPSKIESAQDVERLAETIQKSLERQDPEIKAFLR